MIPQPTRGRATQLAAPPESSGACMCPEFAGVRSLHNHGQPGCKYATPAELPAETAVAS